MFEYFKRIARNNSLKTLQKQERNRVLKAHNFKSAKTVGVLFCFKFEIENKALQHIKSIIKENKLGYKLVIYYPQKQLPENIISDPSNIYFCDKNLNWFGKPQMPEIDSFIEADFDLLIDLNTNKDCFASQYIAAASKAKFKTGRISREPAFYDFLLLGNEDNDYKFVLELESYLSKFI